MDVEIQKADPEERHKLILLCLIAVLTGFVLLVVYDMLISWAAEDAKVATHRVNIVIGSLYILAIPMLVICKMLWNTGRDAIRARRYPPPGMKVIRDTVVVNGVAASRRGKLLQVFCILMVVLLVASPIGLWLLVWKLTNIA